MTKKIDCIIKAFATASTASKNMDKYSTKKISKDLLSNLSDSLRRIDGWGSIEVFIQNHMVTQITEKNIKKPNNKKV